MRILASSDVHGFLGVYRWLVGEAREREVDALILAGDLLTPAEECDSIEDGMRAVAGEIRSILAGVHCPVLYIMGNDDLVDLEGEGPIESIHGRRRELDGFAFVGYAGGPPFLGSPHDREEGDLRRELTALRPLVDEHTIVVTHYPAAGILDGGATHRHGGLRAMSSLLGCCPFLAHIHGHIHRAFGREGNHFNVASAGHRRAMVIELPSLTHVVLSSKDE